MWNGIMLFRFHLTEDKTELNTYLSRDTNSPAENWFKFIKNDFNISKYARPYVFVVNNKQAIDARLKEHLFPGCRRKKTKGKVKKGTDVAIDIAEEVWKPKKKKATYHTTPKMKKVVSKEASPEKQCKITTRGGMVNLQNNCWLISTLQAFCECDQLVSSCNGNIYF